MFRFLKFFVRSAKPSRRKSPRAKSPMRRVCLAVEALEERTVPAVITDMTAMAQLFPVHAGPTPVYLNFDGGYSNAPYSGSDQNIQEILYRTSEIFAPFNVTVQRIRGFANCDQTADGGTTVFIGDNAKNSTYTADDSADYPRMNDHRPNGDDHDVAFVDPGGSNTGTQPIQIAWALAHEVGHTFGLAHVRTDGLTDPAALQTRTTPDIMDYSPSPSPPATPIFKTK